MSIEDFSAPPATALDTVLLASGAVLTRRQGHAVAVNFGSAAGELAACVSAVGLACCSDLTKLVVATGTPAARREAERMAGGPIAPGGARCERGTWWAALGAERFIVICGPTHDQALREQLAVAAQLTPGLGVSDRTEDWAAIAVVGRGKDRVLGDLGVYGIGRDPRHASPLTAHPVAGTSVEWLLQSDHQALALTMQSDATAVWRAIETAGRGAGYLRGRQGRPDTVRPAAPRARALARTDRRPASPRERGMTIDAAVDRDAARRVLLELLALEREHCELEYVRRADALERAGDAIRRLGELAVSEGILARAAVELGTSSEFGRVLISEVTQDTLAPLAIWAAEEPASADVALAELASQPIALEYPLYEHELLRHRGAVIVEVATARARTPVALARVLGWESYVVSALRVGGETIGLLHADAPGAGALDALDSEVAAKFADGLSGVLERAVLRHTLELHRAELTSGAQWMSDRLSRLADATSLAPPPVAVADAFRLADSLTPRELEVLRLLARGHTNRAIATALMVREGTVKYHVKNILRKLGASSRADAVARFVRATAARAPR